MIVFYCFQGLEVDYLMESYVRDYERFINVVRYVVEVIVQCSYVLR